MITVLSVESPVILPTPLRGQAESPEEMTVMGMMRKLPLPAGGTRKGGLCY